MAWTSEGGSISLSAPAPSTQDFQWLQAGPSPSQPTCGPQEALTFLAWNPKAEMLGCRWPVRESAPGHQPHLAAQTPVGLAECPTEALTRHIKEQ